MKLRVIDHNLVRVEDAEKAEVYFVIVDDVFFQRTENRFDAITNNNGNGYQVQVVPVDSIDLVLEITTARGTGPVMVVVEDRTYQHGQIRFTPQIR